MRLLLDTHIYYWTLYNRNHLSTHALEIIAGAEKVYVSAASIWEVAIKVRIGKMKADPARLAKFISASGFRELPIYSKHTKLVSTLPLHHRDPFDRLLISQAMTESLHFLTADAPLKHYSDLVLCV